MEGIYKLENIFASPLLKQLFGVIKHAIYTKIIVHFISVVFPKKINKISDLLIGKNRDN